MVNGALNTVEEADELWDEDADMFDEVTESAEGVPHCPEGRVEGFLGGSRGRNACLGRLRCPSDDVECLRGILKESVVYLVHL